MVAKFNHIIIADDDPDDVDLFVSTLRQVRPEIQVTVAANGLQLINRMGDSRPADAIIIDLNMPLLGGVDFLRFMVGKDDLKSTPVFILSTASNPFEIQQCLSLGAAAYYIKPDNQSTMSEIVNQICDRCYTSTEPGK